MDALSGLIDALRCLPGVGPKSAQRMVYHLLKHQRQRGLQLAVSIEKAMRTLGHCKRCNNYTELEFCLLCQNAKRDASVICVVENPSDLAAIEQSNVYNGSYFVLMGKVSPLDGIGPEDINLSRLYELITDSEVKEIILALSPSVEGQTTCHFICNMLKELPIKISQLAHGIPSGSELECLDGLTIGSALRNRAPIHA